MSEIEVGADGVDVRALMADVEREVQRKREEGLYPPEVLVELDLAPARDGARSGAATAETVEALAGAALGDLQRSSHFTAMVTTASRKPIVAPVIEGARRAIRSGLSWYMNGILQQLATFADNTVRAAGLVNERVSHLEARIRGLEDHLVRVEEWKAEADAVGVPERLIRLERGVRHLRQRLEEGAGAARPGEAAAARAGAWSWKAETSFDYLEFENRFRGDPEIIADRQRAYVELFHGATKPVADLGCGRGEFLGLLRDAGVPCYGVDRHPDMVMLAREKGFEVVDADSLEHLASLEEGSLGGIFCAQMVEHLAPAEVPRLFELAREALAPGAPLVVETINPESLFVFAHAFYVDLGHLRPLHPLTLQFLAEVAGFSSARIEYQSPPPPEFRPQKLPEVEGGDEALAGLVASLDENFRRIDELLYGPQDFAVVAHR